MGDIWFPAKAVAIYSNNKTKFNNINNNKSNKLAYFQLIDN